MMHIFFFLPFLFLMGCDMPPSDETALVFYDTPLSHPVHLFIRQDDHTFAPLENPYGVHLGIHRPFDLNPNTTHITQFETLVNHPHHLFTYELSLGAFPSPIWLLEMVSNRRVPNLILTHHNLLDPFDQGAVYQLATHLGQFHLPMLLHFFPHPNTHHYDPEQYLAFFKTARQIFSELAPKVAFVFSIDQHDILDALAFYPGDAYVDWVGLSMLLPIHEGNSFDPYFLQRLEAFYFMFPSHQPKLLSVGISHFTTQNHSYHLHAAGQLIEQIYQKVLNNYPRIRAIVYQDFNHGHENFSVTANQVVLHYYQQAISDPRFTDALFIPPEPHSGTLLLRSPFKGVQILDEVFIPKLSLVYDFDFAPDSLARALSPHYLNDSADVFYLLTDLQDLGLVIHLDADKNSVVFG